MDRFWHQTGIIRYRKRTDLLIANDVQIDSGVCEGVIYMVEGILLLFAQIGLIIGVALIASGLTKGSNGKEKFNWSATISSVSRGLCILILSICWLVYRYQLNA